MNKEYYRLIRKKLYFYERIDNLLELQFINVINYLNEKYEKNILYINNERNC
jgi:hypothetical protein